MSPFFDGICPWVKSLIEHEGHCEVPYEHGHSAMSDRGTNTWLWVTLGTPFMVSMSHFLSDTMKQSLAFPGLLGSLVGKSWHCGNFLGPWEEREEFERKSVAEKRDML